MGVLSSEVEFQSKRACSVRESGKGGEGCREPRAPQYLHVKQNGGGRGAEERQPASGRKESRTPARLGEGLSRKSRGRCQERGTAFREEGARGKPRGRREQREFGEPGEAAVTPGKVVPSLPVSSEPCHPPAGPTEGPGASQTPPPSRSVSPPPRPLLLQREDQTWACFSCPTSARSAARKTAPRPQAGDIPPCSEHRAPG